MLPYVKEFKSNLEHLNKLDPKEIEQISINAQEELNKYYKT